MSKIILTTTILAASLGLLVSAPNFGALAGVALFDAGLSASKSLVSPGETFTYTFEVKNVTSDFTVDPLFIMPTLSSLVDYVPNSGKAFKGTASADVSNSWLTDGLNLGKLEPGQSAKVTFKAKVKGSATSSSVIESVIQIKKSWLPEGQNEWFQSANIIKVTGKVLGAGDTLPATGPEQVFGISLYLGYLGFLLRRLKLTKFF